MATVEENRAARAQHSRAVAQDAAEAYRAAVRALLEAMEENASQTAALEYEPLTRLDYQTKRRELRKEARALTMDGRDLGIERTVTADKLGVSRMTIHEWLNEGES